MDTQVDFETLRRKNPNSTTAESQKDEKSEAIVVVIQMFKETVTNLCQCQKRIKQLAPGLYKRLYGAQKKGDQKDEDGKKQKAIIMKTLLFFQNRNSS